MKTVKTLAKQKTSKKQTAKALKTPSVRVSREERRNKTLSKLAEFLVEPRTVNEVAEYLDQTRTGGLYWLRELMSVAEVREGFTERPAGQRGINPTNYSLSKTESKRLIKQLGV